MLPGWKHPFLSREALDVVIDGLPDKASNQAVISKAKCCSALLPQFEVCESTFASSLFRSFL